MPKLKERSKTNITKGHYYDIVSSIVNIDEKRAINLLSQFSAINGFDINTTINFWGYHYGSGSLLHVAVACNMLELVKKLIGLGADVNLKNSKHGNALQLAAANCHYSMAVLEYLLNQELYTKKEIKNLNLLHWAARHERVEVIKYLLNNNFNVDESDSDNDMTPLMVAAKFGRIRAINYLVERKARINIQTPNGMTPLMVAAEAGEIDAVKNLVEQGANINTQTPKGETALVFAIRGGIHFEVITFLLANGAAVNIQMIDLIGELRKGVNHKGIEGHDDYSQMFRMFLICGLETKNHSEDVCEIHEINELIKSLESINKYKSSALQFVYKQKLLEENFLHREISSAFFSKKKGEISKGKSEVSKEESKITKLRFLASRQIVKSRLDYSLIPNIIKKTDIKPLEESPFGIVIRKKLDSPKNESISKKLSSCSVM